MTDGGRWLGLSGPGFDGRDLRAAMLMLEMDKRQVAALCGVTVRAVDLWLADKRPVPLLARRVLKGGALGLVAVRTLESL